MDYHFLILYHVLSTLKFFFQYLLIVNCDRLIAKWAQIRHPSDLGQDDLFHSLTLGLARQLALISGMLADVNKQRLEKAFVHFHLHSSTSAMTMRIFMG